MTCRQLGGGCDKKFSAGTFEEIAEMSKTRGIEMFQKGDAEHLASMEKMKSLMEQPDGMHWYQSRKGEFAALPED